MGNAYVLVSATEQEIDFSCLINITAFLVFLSISLAITVSLAFWAYIYIVQYFKERKNGKRN